MSSTTDITAGETFNQLVDNRYNAFADQYEDSGWVNYRCWWGSVKDYRHDTPAWIVKANKHQLFGLAGFASALLIGAVGWLVSLSFDNERASAIVLLAALAIGTVALVTICLQKEPKTVPHLLMLSQDALSAGVFHHIEAAVKELKAGVVRGHEHAATALLAIEQMRPGLEELVDERIRLHNAQLRAQEKAHQVKYVKALDSRRVELAIVMLRVAAEVSAFAELVFLTRDDLLVQVEKTIEADQLPELDLSRTTEKAQVALAAARATLADTARNLG